MTDTTVESAWTTTIRHHPERDADESATGTCGVVELRVPDSAK